jgi:hypothetical protein
LPPLIEGSQSGGKPLFLTCSNQSSKFPFIFQAEDLGYEW